VSVDIAGTMDAPPGGRSRGLLLHRARRSRELRARSWPYLPRVPGWTRHHGISHRRSWLPGICRSCSRGPPYEHCWSGGRYEPLRCSVCCMGPGGRSPDRANTTVCRPFRRAAPTWIMFDRLRTERWRTLLSMRPASRIALSRGSRRSSCTCSRSIRARARPRWRRSTRRSTRSRAPRRLAGARNDTATYTAAHAVGHDARGTAGVTT
jgi:hypothetical protein